MKVVKTFIIFISCVSYSVVGKEVCLPPPGAILWDPNPGNVELEVIWGYGLNLTCHTRVGCNSSLYNDSAYLMGVDDTLDLMDVQLQPIQMQVGNLLRFTPRDLGIANFSIMPYSVDELGFVTCNISRGVPIIDTETNETFLVPQGFLQSGSNYFIAEDPYNPFISCFNGLRVNVTVKSSSCHVTHGASCSGWGVCVTYGDQPSFQCHCCGLYKGENCDIFDSCLSHPCRNGGVCSHPSNDSHEISCDCPLGFFGHFCENQTDDLCDVVDCYNNATCVGNSTSFYCECPPGLTGTHCEVDINECESSPCVHGTCVDERDGFTCHCEPGYHGDTCSERLKACSLSPCKHGGFCQEVALDPFQFTCHCRPGWAGKDCTTKVPACTPNPCTSRGTCVEGDGKFSCICARGFTGSRCEVNINDCDPNPCRFGGICRDGVHGHTCLCVHSHAGSNCEFTLDLFSPILEDVDASGGIIHDPEHTRNLYIVAGTLTAAICIMLTVLVVCYCRMSGSYRSCCGEISKYFWYKRHRDALTLHVDVTSASDCPLAVDSFWRPMDSETDTLGSSSSRLSFQNHTV